MDNHLNAVLLFFEPSNLLGIPKSIDCVHVRSVLLSVLRRSLKEDETPVQGLINSPDVVYKHGFPSILGSIGQDIVVLGKVVVQGEVSNNLGRSDLGQ
jgi:hypothetical protein